MRESLEANPLSARPCIDSNYTPPSPNTTIAMATNASRHQKHARGRLVLRRDVHVGGWGEGRKVMGGGGRTLVYCFFRKGLLLVLIMVNAVYARIKG
jgi:hypothetical protein